MGMSNIVDLIASKEAILSLYRIKMNKYRIHVLNDQIKPGSWYYEFEADNKDHTIEIVNNKFPDISFEKSEERFRQKLRLVEATSSYEL